MNSLYEQNEPLKKHFFSISIISIKAVVFLDTVYVLIYFWKIALKICTHHIESTASGMQLIPNYKYRPA